MKLEFRGGDWQSGAGYDISVRDDGEANHERIEVVDEDAGVGVACDPEVVFHAEMQLDVTWNHAPPRAASDGGLPTTLGDVPDLRTTWHRPAQGRVHRVLSMVLAYAVSDGRLAVNPAAGVSLPRVQAADKRFLNHRQVHELADACGKDYRLLVLFLAYTGLRWVRWLPYAWRVLTSCDDGCWSQSRSRR